MRSTYLWSILDKTGVTKAFLFGSMHLKIDAAFSQYDQAAKSLELCQYFATEIDLAQTSAAEITELFTIPNQMNLSTLLGEKKYEKSRKIFLKSTGIDIEPYQHMQPLYIMNILSTAFIPETKKLNPDTQLFAYAKYLGHRTYGLESMADQINTLENIGIQTQIDSFQKASKNVSKWRKSILDSITDYQTHDIKNLMHRTKKSLGITRKVLLYDRNQKMTNTMNDLINLEKGSGFFVVGAAHLFGKKGLLNNLKNLGFSIKAIRPR